MSKEELYMQWIEEHQNSTGFCSFAHHMREVSTTYKKIIAAGDDIVPTIIRYLKKKDGGGMSVLLLLMDIAKTSPYKPEPILVEGKEIPGFVGYDVKEARAAWIKWGETMETNEIKKSLYKEKTKATLSYIRKGTAYYVTTLFSGAKIYFEIPVSDMGDADFFPEMEAKLLIRWITTYTPSTAPYEQNHD